MTLEADETTKVHKRDTSNSYDKSTRYASSFKLIPTTSTTRPPNTNVSKFQRYTTTTARENDLGSQRSNEIHKRVTTSSYEGFLRYTHPYDFILPTSTTYQVHNETPKAYSEQATLSIFIHEGRPTTTKLTLVDLPSSIDNSTCYECSKGIPFLLLTSHHKPLTKQAVILLYPLHLGRKIASPSTSPIRWKKERESTPKKSIYSTSKHTTTFQVGIQSSNSLTKST